MSDKAYKAAYKAFGLAFPSFAREDYLQAMKKDPIIVHDMKKITHHIIKSVEDIKSDTILVTAIRVFICVELKRDPKSQARINKAVYNMIKGFASDVFLGNVAKLSENPSAYLAALRELNIYCCSEMIIPV